ncbi:hypothetical protein MTR67_002957 [Solanum verrucosum]|uniref:Uncharacterized protein n=1 Tax=Solanum verrucosum TaxID=315347 RepID=A0AAF0PRZ6_SOLVR|nr:hypothetical protein MTR67_002957 [Solanum verrucosum]
MAIRKQIPFQGAFMDLMNRSSSDIFPVAFLGRIVFSEDIQVNVKKTEAVKNFLGPLSLSDVWSFLGAAGYYRRFVEGFSSIDFPLTTLTPKKWLKDYDMSVLYHLGKADVVVDVLIWLSLGSVSKGENYKKNLVCDVHRLARLGIWLVDSHEGGIVVHNALELSFVSDVKDKQHLD